jgi:uncharacterized protein involved in response to NO
MPRKIALWELGFRPLFLLGLFGGATLIGAWLWFFTTGQNSQNYFSPALWHAHEMIYGFAAVVMVGFILTASQNWTNIPGVKGKRLMSLAAVWLLARLLLAFPVLPPIANAFVDVIFLPMAIGFLLPYLGRSEQKSNAIFLVLLTLLTFGNLLMHLSALGILPGNEDRGAYFGLHVIILIIVIMGGRVIPFFSERAIPGYVKPITPWTDRAVIASVAAFLCASFFAPLSSLTGIFAGIAAVVNLKRWLTWLDRRVFLLPILAVLYVGYAWIIIGFTTSALANFSVISLSPATHAFTTGAVGTMIIGMISRVSLGHTGRPIIASHMTAAAYGFISLAAAIRVFGPILAPELYLISIQVSGTIWILAFILVCISYTPYFLFPRIDGRPG